MVRSKFLMAAALVAATLPAPAVAAPVAATTDSSGKALILVPLKLTKVDDLDFGTMIASNISGTVALNAATGARTFAGGVIGVPSAAGHRAVFAGAGTGGQQVIVTIIPPVQLTSGGGDTIDVLALTLDNGGNPIRTIDPITRAFFVGVGGILLINANQPDGDYSATFQVTANYQ
ncbi:MAG TPA: DUF4402 domain-containing protein [Sphingomicrobium sp.]|nr:DUF4402 domain-containing protein [Sphingomicrobium sp.]